MPGFFNRVILIGNLTREPELRYTPQGTAVADLRLAVTTVRGRSGQERKEETLFIDCTVWDKQAETCSKYLAKGQSVLVEGRLIEDQWLDKVTEERRSRIKVYVQNVQFLGGKGGGESGRFDSGISGRYDADASGRFEAPGARRSSRWSQRSDANAAGGQDPFDDRAGPGGSAPEGDDIPF